MRTAHSIAALALALTLGLVGCASAPTSAPERDQGSEQNATDYPASVRTNFVTSCETQPGATTPMCDVCFDSVEEAFTYDEFVKLDTAIRMGTASRADSDKLAEIIADCA